MMNTRKLTKTETKNFPGDNSVNVAIQGTDDKWYYGDDCGDDNPQFVNNEDGEHVEVTE
jgi:hypothetical protein